MEFCGGFELLEDKGVGYLPFSFSNRSRYINLSEKINNFILFILLVLGK